LFSFQKREKEKHELSFYSPYKCINFLTYLDRFIVEQGWDLQKTKTLTGLVFLNIASFYDSRYGRFVFEFGRLYLHERLVDGGSLGLSTKRMT